VRRARPRDHSPNTGTIALPFHFRSWQSLPRGALRHEA
jgi:hypothetical protein